MDTYTFWAFLMLPEGARGDVFVCNLALWYNHINMFQSMDDVLYMADMDEMVYTLVG